MECCSTVVGTCFFVVLFWTLYFFQWRQRISETSVGVVRVTDGAGKFQAESQGIQRFHCCEHQISSFYCFGSSSDLGGNCLYWCLFSYVYPCVGFRFWRKTDQITENHADGENIDLWRNLTKWPVLHCKTVTFHYFAVNQRKLSPDLQKYLIVSIVLH